MKAIVIICLSLCFQQSVTLGTDELSAAPSATQNDPNAHQGGVLPTRQTPSVIKRDVATTQSNSDNAGGELPTSQTPSVVKREVATTQSKSDNTGGELPTSQTPSVVKREVATTQSKSDNTGGELPSQTSVVKRDVSKTQSNSGDGGAFLATGLSDESSTRHRRSGRPITISQEHIDQMKNVPVSALSTDLEPNKKIILDVHNGLRRNGDPIASNMLKLVWSEEAAKTAANWAKSCNQFHSLKENRTIPGFSCGENLFMASYKASWEDVIKSFWSEIEDFIYGKGAIDGRQVLHYTQVMWYRSWLIGCSVYQCPITDHSLEFYYVCHYCPAGNNANPAYPYKTGKPCADCPGACENGLCTNGCKYQNKYSNCDSPKASCGNPTDEADCPATCFCNNNEIR